MLKPPQEINLHLNKLSSAKKYGDTPKNVFYRAWHEKY